MWARNCDVFGQDNLCYRAVTDRDNALGAGLRGHDSQEVIPREGGTPGTVQTLQAALGRSEGLDALNAKAHPLGISAD